MLSAPFNMIDSILQGRRQEVFAANDVDANSVVVEYVALLTELQQLDPRELK